MSGSVGGRIIAFLKEAKRRKVYTSVVAYAAVSIGLIELVGSVQQALLFPDWTSRLVTFLLLLGFPVVLALAWIFDFGSHGVVRTPPADGEEQQRAGTHRRGGAAAGESRGGLGRVTGSPTRRPDLKARPMPAAPQRPAPSLVLESSEPPDPDRVKRVTLAHIRHELRTPINAIIGYSEMLLEEDAPESARPDLRRIHEAGRNLLGLVDSILAPDKLAGSIERDLDSFGAEIRAELRTPITSVVGYAEMLIENEREQSRDELIPDLERIRGAGKRLLDLSGDLVRLATVQPGAGIGAELAGTAAMATEVLSKIRPVDAGAAAMAHEGEGSLLIVDDNAMNRDLLSRQLARHGYIVATASNGVEALDALQRQSFDLVLLDVIMPEMDGVETLHRIKGDERLRDIPVIMLSSLDEVDSAIRCIELGAEEYLAKPVKPSLLEARISANLEIRRMRERESIYRENATAAEALIERLLLASFPAAIAGRVRAGETDIVESFPDTTVLWCTMEGTPRGVDPGSWVQALRDVLAVSERLSDELGIETCLVRADGFAAVAGAPTPREDHADVAARLALALLSELGGEDGAPAPLRLGLHTGSSTGAVIGDERLRYELWGDALDTARGLAARGAAGSVLVSPTAHTLLRGRFGFDNRGVIEVVGKGQMRAYVLRGPTGEAETEMPAAAAR